MLLAFHLIPSIFSLADATEYRLKFVYAIWRHGERTPLYTFTTNPIQEVNWTLGQGGYGALTPRGMQQQFKLGSELRKRYIDSGFLSSKYSSSEIFYEALPDDRVLASAQANSFGMFRDSDEPSPSNEDWPSGVVPIPVQTITEFARGLAKCPRYAQFAALKAESGEFATSLASPEYALMKAGIKLGGITANISNYKQFYEAAVAERAYFPDSVAMWLSDEMFDALRSFYNEQFDLDYGHGYTTPTRGVDLTLEIPRLNGGMVMERVVKSFRSSIQGDSPRKYRALSGNDIAIAGVLNVLGIKGRVVNGQPGYASSIIFELLEDGRGEHFFKVLYRHGPNGSYEAITKNINGCREDECEISILEDIAEKFSVDLIKDCTLLELAPAA